MKRVIPFFFLLSLIVSCTGNNSGNEKPVPPGANGTVEVVFDSSNREGKQTKTVTIRSNASTPVIILRITADIVTNFKIIN